MGNRIFRGLADGDRRHIISSLLKSDDGIVTVDDLTQEIATQSDDREQVRLRLYHCHLPKLRDLGFLDYDWRSGDVVLTEGAKNLRAIFEATKDEEEEVPPTIR